MYEQNWLNWVRCNDESTALIKATIRTKGETKKWHAAHKPKFHCRDQTDESFTPIIIPHNHSTVFLPLPYPTVPLIRHIPARVRHTDALVARNTKRLVFPAIIDIQGSHSSDTSLQVKIQTQNLLFNTRSFWDMIPCCIYAWLDLSMVLRTFVRQENTEQ